jgi:MFS family permease
MDIAPEHSGTASGMMNTGSALAAIISPVVSGFLIDRFGNWELPFLGSMGLMGIGMLLALRMRPDSPFRNVAIDNSDRRPFSGIPTRPVE